MVTVGRSTICPTPCGSAIAASVGLVRLISSCSRFSKLPSLAIETVTVLLVSPAANVSVPVSGSVPWL